MGKNKDEICRDARRTMLYGYQKALKIYTENRKKDEDKALRDYKKECSNAEKKYIEICVDNIADW